MTNPNDLDRAYLIDKVFANFTKNIIEQWNDPNENEENNYDSNIEYEPDDDYDVEYTSETEEEICFASTYEIRSREPEKITVEGRTFDSYNDFMDFMFTQQSDEELDKGIGSQKKEEQVFVIDTDPNHKENEANGGTKKKYNPSRYYAMLSNRSDLLQISVLNVQWLNIVKLQP